MVILLSRYKFRLQKVLDMRKSKEEESIVNFKEAQKQKNLVEDRLDNLKDKYIKYSAIKSDESIIHQKIKYQYLTSLNYCINETTMELNQKDEVLQEARKDLNEKRIDRKIVEVLKDKREQEYLKSERLKEQKNNDEFALYGFIRNKMSS